MGRFISPSGAVHEVESITGHTTLENLIKDLVDDDLCDSYRIGIIHVIGELKHHGTPAIAELNNVRNKQVTNRILKESIDKTLKILEVFPLKASIRKDSVRTRDQDTEQQNLSNTYTVAVPKTRKMELNNVTFEDVTNVAEVISHRQCNFCQKLTAVTPTVVNFSRIAGDKRFFCLNCLRNGYYDNKITKNILILSFRAVFGYYFHCFTHTPKGSNSYGPGHVGSYDLKELLEIHYVAGQGNPLFRWDHESISWFVDFSKVGEGQNQIPVTEILKTVTHMLFHFNFPEHVNDLKAHLFYKKIEEGVLTFYKKREVIGNNGKVFSPNFHNCGIPTVMPANSSFKPVSESFLNNFKASQINDKKR